MGISGKRFLLCGNYGFRNLGDDTILHALISALDERKAQPLVLAEDPKAVEERFGCRSFLWRDWSQIFQALRESDAVIIGGGGLIQEYWGTDPATIFGAHHDLTYYCGIAQAARLFHLPYALFALGAGPVVSPAGRELVRDTVINACYVSVRDAGSRVHLASVGVPSEKIHVGADAATLVLPGRPSQNAEKDHLLVNLRPWPFWPKADQALRGLAGDLARLASEHGLTITLTAFTSGCGPEHSDEAFLQEFRQLLSAQGVAASDVRIPASFAEAEPLFSRARLGLVMRYHAALFAAAWQVPFLALAYDPKLEHLLEELDYRSFCLALSEVESSETIGKLALGARDQLPAPSLDRYEAFSRRAKEDLERLLTTLDDARHAAGPKLSPLSGLALERLAAEAAARSELENTLRFTEAEREALARKAAVLHEEVQRLATERDALQQQHAQLVEAYGERQREVEKLSSEWAKASAERDSLQQQHAQLVEAYGQRQQELDRVHRILAQITSTKWFKVASVYWRFRERLRKRPKAHQRTNESMSPPPAASPPASSSHAAGEALADTGTQEDCLAVAPIPVEQAWLRDLVNNPRYDILILPIIEWDFRFQRPQQLARQFAGKGHRVFYASHKFGEALAISEKGERVWEVSLRGPKRNVYRDHLDAEACQALFSSVDQLRRDYLLGATAVVVQLPFWWPLAQALRKQFGWPVVYDCMDFHAGFSTNEPAMLAEEEELLAQADLVAVSSQFLESEARKRNANVVMVPNGCDFGHFAQVPIAAPSDPPVIGYYGAIADWFDSDLVADLAEREKDWQFLLVGSTFSADTRRLKRLPNVQLVGEKPYAELPRWIEKMDVLIIPFKKTPLTEATNPVKFYEIMAAGKPLVSVPLPELLPYRDLVAFADSAQEFSDRIRECLSRAMADEAERRRDFARSQTWEQRAETFLQHTAGAFRKATVIIVTYNNLALTRSCLESLFARTEWPNLEVFVVDNSSSDGTPTYLRQLEQEHPNLHVILNSENRGFAAANNQALRRATGDFLVLLNNDTVVTRGWLAGLIRHLCANPKLGLVCASTNAAGNEAQVEVGYNGFSELPLWAAEFAKINDSKLVPLTVVPLFAAALRATTYKHIGPLDERFELGMFEDNDYSHRTQRAGLFTACARDVFIHHTQKASFRLLGEAPYLSLYLRNKARFESKWGRQPPPEKPSWQPIVFLQSVGWNIQLAQRPHHLAREFAKHGFLTLFDCSNSWDDVSGLKLVSPNLFLFHDDISLLHHLDRPILWTLPYNFHLAIDFPQPNIIVYDIIDDLSVFPYDQRFLFNNHRKALQQANLVFYVARHLYQQIKHQRPDAIYLPNGVEFERFAGPPLPQLDKDFTSILQSGKPVCGYYGALASWFDQDLLHAVAKERPDWEFVLIGPKYDHSWDNSALLQQANVHWLGPKPYESLPSYLSLFTVAMIPFKINEITLATSPLKLYEYFAAGKPVIATPMPECASFAEVFIVRDVESFSTALDQARELEQQEEFRNRLRQIGFENSWAARVRSVLELIGQGR